MDAYKLVLVGDGRVGKSAFVQHHLIGEFQTSYLPTLGVEVHPLTLKTNKGLKHFNVWDCAGQERFGGLRDAYYTNADCAIVMYDCESPVTMFNVNFWVKKIRAKCGNIPIVVCGNKCDIGSIQLFTPRPETQWLVSAKSGENCEKPLLHLLRELTHQDLA